MTRVIPSQECPACSGRGKTGKRVWMHVTHWRNAQNGITQVDEFCPRCLWMRVTDVASGKVQEGRGRKVQYARAS